MENQFSEVLTAIREKKCDFAELIRGKKKDGNHDYLKEIKRSECKVLTAISELQEGITKMNRHSSTPLTAVRDNRCDFSEVIHKMEDQTSEVTREMNRHSSTLLTAVRDNRCDFSEVISKMEDQTSELLSAVTEMKDQTSQIQVTDEMTTVICRIEHQTSQLLTVVEDGFSGVMAAVGRIDVSQRAGFDELEGFQRKFEVLSESCAVACSRAVVESQDAQQEVMRMVARHAEEISKLLNKRVEHIREFTTAKLEEVQRRVLESIELGLDGVVRKLNPEWMALAGGRQVLRGEAPHGGVAASAMARATGQLRVVSEA